MAFRVGGCPPTMMEVARPIYVDLRGAAPWRCSRGSGRTCGDVLSTAGWRGCISQISLVRGVARCTRSSHGIRMSGIATHSSPRGSTPRPPRKSRRELPCGHRRCRDCFRAPRAVASRQAGSTVSTSTAAAEGGRRPWRQPRRRGSGLCPRHRSHKVTTIAGARTAARTSRRRREMVADAQPPSRRRAPARRRGLGRPGAWPGTVFQPARGRRPTGDVSDESRHQAIRCSAQVQPQRHSKPTASGTGLGDGESSGQSDQQPWCGGGACGGVAGGGGAVEAAAAWVPWSQPARSRSAARVLGPLISGRSDLSRRHRDLDGPACRSTTAHRLLPRAASMSWPARLGRRRRPDRGRSPSCRVTPMRTSMVIPLSGGSGRGRPSAVPGTCRRRPMVLWRTGRSHDPELAVAALGRGRGPPSMARAISVNTRRPRWWADRGDGLAVVAALAEAGTSGTLADQGTPRRPARSAPPPAPKLVALAVVTGEPGQVRSRL